MTPQELKNSILQLAIQGRLVEQRPEEGTAEELYREIIADKRIRLKGKKEGKLSPETIPEEEIPFEIPNTWKWVRFGHIVINRDAERIPLSVEERKNLKKSYDYYGASGVIDKVDKFLFDRKLLLIGEDGANLLLRSTPIAFLAEGRYWVNNHAHVLDCNEKLLCMEYIMYFINAISLARYVTGTAQPKMNQEKMNSIPVSLPPLAEQKRIVAKIEEMLPYIDRYEKAWSLLEDFNKRFPTDMQKSILQLAIQGKLVPQRPEEGTGEELYQQIQSEKQSLIRSGKLKKEKPLPEISDSEIPFDIPESWKWVRIGKIFNLQAGKNKTSAEIFEETSPEHQYKCYGGNGCRGYVADYNRTGHYAIIGRQGALCGNINYAEGDFYATEHAVVVEQFAETNVLWCGYFLKALNLNQYATATAQPGLAVANINLVLIPLPPIAEQKRIVAKLEELLPICDNLE